MVVPQENEVRVSFPAQRTFSRLGRVSVGGLAVRLSIDISTVEELRLAADAAVSTLLGDGRITMTSQWNDQDLVIRLENPLSTLDYETDLESDLSESDTRHVERIVEPPSRIFLRVRRQEALVGSDEEE